MGNFFSNISVLKTDFGEQSVVEKVTQYMKEQGFFPVKVEMEAAKTILVRNNPQSKWMTIYDDDFDYETARNFTEFLSRELNTYTMLIQNIDSDFMTIHLFRQTKKDYVVVGYPYDLEMEDEQPGNGILEAWAPLAKNPEKLLDAFRQEYVCSEDVLNPMEEEIAINSDDINTPYDYAITNDADYLKLHFTVDPEGKSALGETQLYSSGRETSTHVNRRNHYAFINCGKASKGLVVALYGYSIEHDTATVEEITITRIKDFRKPDDDTNVVEATEKTEQWKLNNGEKCLISRFDDFEIPEGYMDTSRAYYNADTKREISITFVPKGNEETGAVIHVLVQPNANPNGGAVAFGSQAFY